MKGLNSPCMQSCLCGHLPPTRLIAVNPYAAGGLFGHYKIMQKILKMTEPPLAHGYSYESAQRELSTEYQHNRVSMVFKKSLRPCVLNKSSLSIGRVRLENMQQNDG